MEITSPSSGTTTKLHQLATPAPFIVRIIAMGTDFTLEYLTTIYIGSGERVRAKSYYARGTSSPHLTRHTTRTPGDQHAHRTAIRPPERRYERPRGRRVGRQGAQGRLSSTAGPSSSLFVGSS
jgi:hypothetical protein